MIPFDPAFPAREYETRLEHVRRGMAQRRLDALVLFSAQHVYYLSGMEISGGYLQPLIVPLEGDPTIIIFDFHEAGADNSCWLRNRIVYSSFEDPVEVALATIRKLGLERGRLGLERRSTLVTPAVYTRLAGALWEAHLEDPFGVVENVRLRKSPAEIAYIRQAAALTDLAVEAAYKSMVVGARDTDVAAAIEDALYRAGSEPSVSPPVVAAGYRSGVAHSNFNGVRLAKGDTCFLEYTGRVRRYVAPVMRTAVLGQPTGEIERAASAGAEACLTLIRMSKPGVPCSEVAKAALAVLEPALPGLVFHHDFGYSVGIHYPLSWHEPLGCMLRVENQRPLEAGMVYHLPMSLRKYGEFGIGQSHTMLVTETGAEALTRSPHQLRVLDI